ncbi:polycystin-1-like isoform X2 [Asterias amurensis]|uniref:polycystin-1-like isoform X2 n=1 Tax=Asterias amurensis TaxID=7602 RepID=UPI003AB1DA0A
MVIMIQWRSYFLHSHRAYASTDETYEGCFREDPSQREFIVAGGDHDFNNVNPKLCKALCKSMDYPHAALQRGYMCLCGETVGTHSNGSQFGCNLRCAGSPTDFCGGMDFSSVYSTSTSVKSVVLVDPGYIVVFKEAVIETTLEAGSDTAVYSFDFGDSTGIADWTPGPQPHVFSDVGVYLVKVWVKNDASGDLEARKEVYIEAPISDLRTVCNSFIEVDFPFECIGRVGQGNNMDVTWNFNDGSTEVNMKIADAQRFSVGSPIPRRLDNIEPALNLQGVYLIPALEFMQEAKLEAWEVFAVKEGRIKLQVYRPLCDENEKYCPHNRTCITKYFPCPPVTETPCKDNYTAFCLESASCQPFHTTYYFAESNSTFTIAPCENQTQSVQSNNGTTNGTTNGTINGTVNGNISSDGQIKMCNYSEPFVRMPQHFFWSCSSERKQRSMRIPYGVIGQTIVYLQEGYNIFTVNETDRFTVQSHDWVGFGPYQQKFPDYYRQAAYPLVGEVAHFLTDNETVFFKEQDLLSQERDVRREDADRMDISFYIRAHVSKPSMSWVSHSYSTSGMFEINTKYNNLLGKEVEALPQWIASQYRILTIQGLQFTRNLGIYYACNDEAYPMYVEITQGTYVRFTWTFPDSSTNTSLPFLTNDITDGPDVKTTDTQSYLFSVIGNYTTHVKAYNNVSSVDIILSIISRYRITGLNGTIELYPGDNTTSEWNTILSGCWFNYSSFIMSGNVVQYQWDHGDGSTSGDWSFDTTHDHFYLDPGIYTVLIKSDNIASTLDHTFDVTAVKPNYVQCQEYTTSEIQTLFFCEVTWHTGEGLTFNWDFGDGASVTIENTGFIWHNYSTFNTYDVECTISNYPAVSDIQSIIVQDPVEGVILHNKTDVQATGDTVEFIVTWSRGNDVHFDWYFGDDGEDTTSAPSVEYVYTRIGYYNVTVNVSNMVSWMLSDPIIVEIQERVTDVEAVAQDNLIYTPVLITAIIATGNKVWYDYVFGDSSNVTHLLNSSFIHTYTLPETYTVTIRAYNNVSDESATTSIQIDASISSTDLFLTTPHIRANVLEARCVANNGSNVLMTFDWGDGTVSSKYNAAFFDIGSDYTDSHTYQSEGTFNVTCFSENPWASGFTFRQVIVQEEIVALLFQPEVCVKGKIFDFVVPPFVGDSRDVLLFWDYDDGMQFTTDAFTHQYVYRDAGHYEVTVRAQNLVSEFSIMQLFYVQEHVVGLMLLADVYPVIPSQPILLAWEITYGTEVVFTIDLGDGTEQIFEQKDVGKVWSVEYIYSGPGSYDITVTASNKLNSLTVSTIAYVEYAIEGLRAYIRGNKTTHTDQSAFILIEIQQGTNVEYTCDYHDGSHPIVTTKLYCKHMFIDIGYHLVTVMATNHLSSALVLANDTYNVLLPPTPHQIKGLAVGAPQAAIQDQMTVFRLNRFRGNRFNCTWDFGDNSTILKLDQYFVYIPINHTYSQIGEYVIQVNCTNFFHPEVFASKVIIVQVPASGLNITSRKIGQYGLDLIVNISLITGTDVESVLELNSRNYTFVMNGSFGQAIIPGGHINESGWQNVSITARNLVPPVLTLHDQIYIEAEISGIEVWAETPFVALGEPVTLYVSIATGTNVLLEWHFGTNFVITSTLNATTTKKTDTKQHLYPALGLYAAFVVASNEIGMMTHTPLLIAVEDKVWGFSLTTDTPVRYPDGNITFNLYWDTRVQKLPTNASITFDFGEWLNPLLTIDLGSLDIINWIEYNLTRGTNCDSPEESINNPLCSANFTDAFVDGPIVNFLTLTHTYSPGMYPAVVTVHNLVSQQVFTVKVQTEVPIFNCSITSHNVDRPGVKYGTPGGGPNQNYFPVEYPVHLMAHVTEGTAVKYIWRFGDGVVESSSDAHIAHLYTDSTTFSIRLLTMNIFNFEDSSATLILQESVIGLFAAHSGPVAQFELITLIVFAAQPGTQATYTVQVGNYSNVLTTPVINEDAVKSALALMNPNIFLPFDPYTHAVTMYNLTFNASGDHEVVITGSNYASSLSVTTLLPITDDPCRLPHVVIHGGSKNISNPWRVKRNQLIILVSEVTLDCASTMRALFQWDAYVVSYFNDKPLPANQLFGYGLSASVKATNADLVIPRRTLDYNTYLLQLTVTMDNDAKVLNKNQTFIEVMPSDLVISIIGGSAVTISWNESISLDASKSFDPDEMTLKDRLASGNQTTPLYKNDPIIFSWYCRLQDEIFQFEEGFIAPNPDNPGCLGDGPDVTIATGTSSYNILLENLTRSSQYVFGVVGSKEGRDAQYFIQTVRVIHSEPPKLQIRCIRNCGYKINPQKRLALEVECVQCWNTTEELEYTWNVTSLGSEQSGFQQDVETVTGSKGPYFILRPSLFLLHQDSRFSVGITVYNRQLQSFGYSEYQYVIGEVPDRGSCSITPAEGVALSTQFVITCTGFHSAELPLHHEFLYSTGNEDVTKVTGAETTPDEMFTLLYYSPEGVTPPMTLPMGVASKSYMVEIHIEVTDSLGIGVHQRLQVKVLPPDDSKLTTELTALSEGSTSTLGLYLEKGDTQSATKLINTLASVLNENTGEQSEGSGLDDEDVDQDADWLLQKENVRFKLVEKLSDIKILNLDITKQTSAAMTQAIYNPDEISLDTQVLAADSYLSMIDILKDESREGTGIDVIEDTSRNFYSGASSLLQAAARQVQSFYKELEGDPKEWDNFWNSEGASFSNVTYPETVALTLSKSSDTDVDLSVPDIDIIEQEPWVPYQLQTSRNVTKKVFAIIDEVSTTILSAKVPGELATKIHTDAILLMLQRENLRDLSVRFYHVEDGAWFKIPSEAMAEIAGSYGQDDISTQVLSLSENPYSWHLSASEIKTSVIGLSLKDDNGEELIVTDLSSKIEMLIPRGDDSSIQFDSMKASNIKLLYIHFNVTESHSSIHIDIYPDETLQDVPLDAFIRYGFYPTLEEYDLKITLPIPKEHLYSSIFNQTQNLTTNPYTWFIPENMLYAVGAYYLGVRPLTGDEEERRSQGGGNKTDVEVEEIEVDMNVKIYTARCLYWSTVYEQWFPHGCEVGSLTTASFTHCLCNHLSSFGGSFFVPPNRQVFIPEEQVEVIDHTTTFMILYVMGVALGVFLMVLGCGLVADWRFSKQLYGDMELKKSSYIVTFFTGMDLNSGTTAKVYLSLHSSSMTTEPIQLKNPDHIAFKGSCVDSFLVTTRTELGKVNSVTVWHDDQGYSPQWHLSRILVQNYVTGEKIYFLCNHVLASSNTQVTFNVASPAQLNQKLHLFETEPSYRPLVKHFPLWNIISRSIFSQFTHSQRVASFFTPFFLSTLTVTLLKWFQDSSNEESVSLNLDMSNIMIGIEAGAVALLVYYLLVYVFSVCRRRPTGNKTASKRSKESSATTSDAVNVKKPKSRRFRLAKKTRSLEEVKVDIPGIRNKQVQDLGALSMKSRSSDKMVTEAGSALAAAVGIPRIMSSSSWESEDWSDYDDTFEDAPSPRNINQNANWPSWEEYMKGANQNQNANPEGDSDAGTLQFACKTNSGHSRWSLSRHRKSTSPKDSQDGDHSEPTKLHKRGHGGGNGQHLLVGKNPNINQNAQTGTPSPGSSLKKPAQTLGRADENKRQSRSQKPGFSKRVFNQPEDESQGERKSTCCGQHTNRQFFLPWWSSIIIWFIMLLSISGSVALTVYLTMGYTLGKAINWLLPVMIAFAQNLFLIQPILAFLSAIFESLFVKRDCLTRASIAYEATTSSFKSKTTPNIKMEENDIQQNTSRIMRGHQLGKHQESSGARSNIKTAIKKHVAGLLFLALVVFLAHGKRDVSHFYMTSTTKDMFINGAQRRTMSFIKVHTADQFWQWSNETFLPGLAPIMTAERNYQYLQLIGTPRLRQLRVNQTVADTCRDTIIGDVPLSSSPPCSSSYTPLNEDTSQYLNSWQPTSPDISPALQPSGYRFYTSEELLGAPYVGKYATYHGGGYTADLVGDYLKVVEMFQSLETSQWIDEYTRAVFVEFLLLNVQLNLTSVVRLVSEVLPTGYQEPVVCVGLVNVGESSYWLGMMYLGCLGLLGVSVYAMIFTEAHCMLRWGRTYYTSMRHLVGFLNFIVALLTVALMGYQLMTTSQGMVSSPSFGAFITVQSMQYYVTTLSGVLVFTTMIKVLFQLECHQRISLLLYSCETSFQQVLKSVVMFVAMLMTFVFTGWTLYSGHLRDFHSLPRSAVTLFNIFIGGLTVETNQQRTFPVFIMVFLTFFGFSVLLFITVIILQTYKSSRFYKIMSQFVSTGCLTRYVCILKHRLIVKKTHRKMEVRRYITLRQSRALRNRLPVIPPMLAIKQIEDRVERLLESAKSDNEVLFSDTKMLSRVIVREYNLLKALKKTGSLK